MTLRDRTEIQLLLEKADEARRRIRELQDNLEQLYRRIGRLRAGNNEPDPRSGRGTQASRKK